MADETPVWNLTERQWEALLGYAGTGADALEDGAYVRVDTDPTLNTSELHFYATSLNAPSGWQYPFFETVPGSRHLGAFVGRARHETATGFVQFEVILYAAAQALSADYESGVSDLDYVTYEQAVEQAVRGRPEDWEWLHREFRRLAGLVHLAKI